MGGLVDRELTLASGKQKEKSCCWEGLLIGEWCKECFVFLFDICVICRSTFGNLR